MTSDETIVLNLILATALLERAGDMRSKVLAAYAGSDLTSNAAVTEFHGYVGGLVETSPPSARGVLVSLRESIAGRLFTLATNGYSRSERARIDREHAGESGTTYAPFRERTSRPDPAAALETPVAVSYDLGDGPGLGKHVMPVFPPRARSLSDFEGFPRSCSKQARKHLNEYAAIVAEHRGLSADDAEKLRAWADDFFVIDAYRKSLSSMTTSETVLRSVVEICFAHAAWSLHREAFDRELNEARQLLRASRSEASCSPVS